MNRNIVVAAALGAALCMAPAAQASATHGNLALGEMAKIVTVAVNPTEALIQTRAVLRDLWIGHVFWVRSVVVARQNANDRAEAIAETRVVANAKALAGSIEPFYGTKASEALFGLLAGHYGAVKAYLDGTQHHSKAEQDKATGDLVTNADKIATFLGTANPYLPHDAVLGLLQVHAGHHIAQIDDLYAGKYAEEAEVWSDMTQHMYVIADAIADALAKQFPEKF